MISKGDATIREISGLIDVERKSIMNFLQGAVYCWCKNRKDEWFSMIDLMGGDNRDWNGTPLEILYHKQIQSGKTEKEAYDEAGKESGWLLKKVISDDNRQFETEKTAINRKYRWLGN